MLNQYIQELEQDPFDGEEFVERLAWRVNASMSAPGSSDSVFDPDLLHEAFTQAIKDLQILDDRTAKKCERMEVAVREEEVRYWHNIAQLLEHNKEAFQSFQDLDSHINSVATKVVHLGDQLESVNTPRSRAVEAQRLMDHFRAFLLSGPLVSEVFTDKSKIYEAADVIQKLHLIAQELPSGKFETAKKKIAEKYDEIECSLIMEFVKAHRAGDKDRMKEIASTLSHFKGYSQCIDAFIEEAQHGSLRSQDMYHEVVPLCRRSEVLIKEVFTNPDQVMGKFVLNIFQGQLQEYIQMKLENKTQLELYLKNLHELYCQTVKLCTDLQTFNLGNDSQFLSKLTKSIFQRHLNSYISIETRFLKEKFGLILSRYYENKGHQKKNIQSGVGSINDIRRNIQDVIGTKANINIGPAVENYGGETFLSEEVAISLLQETKQAFKRCQMLSSQSDVHNNAVQIFDLLAKALLNEHVDYAIELGLQVIPGGEVRTPPEVSFFEVVHQSSSMMNLLDKLFSDTLVPLVISTPKHGDCLQKKKQLGSTLEQKLDLGLDRTLSAIVSYVRHVLTVEQKRTDFKPEDDDMLITNVTVACQRVVRYINLVVERIRDSLDGHNLESVLLELGLRFHRTIFDHLMKFEYSATGAMAVICDVNEYRKCVANFKIPQVNSLFDTLHTLCKLLQVTSKNLKMVCSGDQLSGLDRNILTNFIQLRADYKTAKLGNQLK
ncbi:exocyst complex component 5-like isoform X1 [Portunus trituberculatus]|uniref:exocyst complex component 5-like isoform X1 n=2 Tax=Portunus trituberculatus TaxID=210409 RepID=UPI001E1D17B2|nr:exocyst complex component 5-like isoform X1 [Portunus trituberculatus]